MSSPSRRRILAALSVLALSTTLVGASAGNANAPSEAEWVGTWTAAPAAAGAGSSALGFTNQSVRMIVHTSVGGEGLRIRISDTFGDRGLQVGHATVALPDTSTPALTDVDAATIHELTFGGSSSVVVRKGAQVLSDPVTMAVPALGDLVVTLFFPVATGPSTWHFHARATSYVGDGDLAATAAGAGFTITRTSWYFLTAVDVLDRHSDGAVVVLGDSIAEGFSTPLNGNKRWPNLLADRLITGEPDDLRDLGVLNEALLGNQVNHDGSEIGFNELGVNALARLHRDVLSQTGARTLILALGINDIQGPNDPAATIIAGLRQIAEQTHEDGMTVIATTITPFEGFRNWTAEKEATRQAVNAFLRGSDDFDGLIDFDALLRDPDQPSKLRADWDSGDHLHPNEAGHHAMAEFVPLPLLRARGDRD